MWKTQAVIHILAVESEVLRGRRCKVSGENRILPAFSHQNVTPCNGLASGDIGVIPPTNGYLTYTMRHI